MRDHRNDGIAGKLLQYVCRRLSGKEKGRGAVLFALTARAREWFLRQGFVETDPADLPAQLRKEILLRLQARGAKRHLLSARSDSLRPSWLDALSPPGGRGLIDKLHTGAQTQSPAVVQPEGIIVVPDGNPRKGKQTQPAIYQPIHAERNLRR